MVAHILFVVISAQTAVWCDACGESLSSVMLCCTELAETESEQQHSTVTLVPSCYA